MVWLQQGHQIQHFLIASLQHNMSPEQSQRKCYRVPTGAQSISEPRQKHTKLGLFNTRLSKQLKRGMLIYFRGNHHTLFRDIYTCRFRIFMCGKAIPPVELILFIDVFIFLPISFWQKHCFRASYFDWYIHCRTNMSAIWLLFTFEHFILKHFWMHFSYDGGLFNVTSKSEMRQAVLCCMIFFFFLME